jgi:hypothetical protein
MDRVQRLLTVGAARRTHADYHDAIVGYMATGAGPDDGCRRYNSRRTSANLLAPYLTTASPSPGLAVPALSGHMDDRPRAVSQTATAMTSRANIACS